MLALRIARNLSRSAPAAVNAGVSRAFASSRIAANEAGAGEGDPVKDVFTRVQRDFRRLMDATPGVKVPVGGSEEEIAKFAWKRYDAAYELGIQSPEELAADVAEALRKPGQSAKQYLEKVDEHRERFGFEDTDGLSAALKTAVAEIEKKTGQTLMVDDEAGMAKLAETVAPLVENVMRADEDALESASIEEAAAEELAELAELKKSMRPPQIDAKTGQPKERATTEQIVARAKEAIESGRLKPAQAESLRKLLAQGQ